MGSIETSANSTSARIGARKSAGIALAIVRETNCYVLLRPSDEPCINCLVKCWPIVEPSRHRSSFCWLPIYQHLCLDESSRIVSDLDSQAENWRAAGRRETLSHSNVQPLPSNHHPPVFARNYWPSTGVHWWRNGLYLECLLSINILRRAIYADASRINMLKKSWLRRPTFRDMLDRVPIGPNWQTGPCPSLQFS